MEQSYIKKLETIFIEEGFPIPKGFSDKDVDLSAPPLYTDLFALSFVYRVGQLTVPHYSTTLTKVARSDVVKFFDECLKSSTNLYKKSLNLMLSKGIYDRPPKIPYPNEVEFMKKQQSLLSLWFGDKRPLNTSELGEEEHLNIPVIIEVTNSTVSPFSDRLILFLITSTTAAGIYLTAYTISVSMRKDLVAHYSVIMSEIMNYCGEGLEIMINREWMEQPPQPINRHDLYKT